MFRIQNKGSPAWRCQESAEEELTEDGQSAEKQGGPKALEAVLEVTRNQQAEIDNLRVSVLALREAVDSGKPPVTCDAAEKQVLEYLREGGQELGEFQPLKRHVENVRAALRQTVVKKPARRHAVGD